MSFEFSINHLSSEYVEIMMSGHIHMYIHIHTLTHRKQFNHKPIDLKV